MSRLFKTYEPKVTQTYKPGAHNGIDLVGDGGNGKMLCDYIRAHSDGEVEIVVNNYSTQDKTGNSYGNVVRIHHDNGMYTVYAHMKLGTVRVSVGDKVKAGDILGYMGNTGHTTGAHLHFEVRNTSNIKIDPTPYINSDLPNMPQGHANPSAETIPEPSANPTATPSADGERLSVINANGECVGELILRR